METREDLLRRAEEALALARLISYGPDKERLIQQADSLRRQAEQRSFDPKS